MLAAGRVYASPSGGPERGPDVVTVGAASRDVAASDPRGWRLGGSTTYCALALARLGLRAGALVGADAEAAGAAELEALEAAGVQVRRVPLANGPVFENIDCDGHRRQRWLSKSDRVPVAAIPDDWRGAAGWMLVPVAGEVGEEWASIPRQGCRVVVGWQGLLREFDSSGWVERIPARPVALLEAAGLVCASLDDLTPDSDMAALCELAPNAAIVLTAGNRGGAVVRGGRLSRYRAVPSTVVDPTGAGDVFMAALTAAWLLTGELTTSRPLRFAAAAAALTVEGLGLAGVPSAAEIAARLRGTGAAGWRP